MVLLKTKIKSVFRLIEIEDGENDLYTIVNKVFTAHNIEYDEDIAVEFFENDGAPVTANHLFQLIQQHQNCASFYIELVPMAETHKKITSAVSCSQILKYLEFSGIYGFFCFSNWKDFWDEKIYTKYSWREIA